MKRCSTPFSSSYATCSSSVDWRSSCESESLGYRPSRPSADSLSLPRRSGKNVFTRPAPIDLSSARQYAFSLDLDLDDEEALATERRALGGDVEAMGRGGRRQEERPFMLDSDEED